MKRVRLSPADWAPHRVNLSVICNLAERGELRMADS
jgi:hypothetical protein